MEVARAAAFNAMQRRIAECLAERMQILAAVSIVKLAAQASDWPSLSNFPAR